MKHTVYKYAWENAPEFIKKYKIEASSYIEEAAVMENENILTTVLNPTNKRFCIFDNSGQLVREFGEYPESNIQFIELEAYYCQFVVNYSKNRIFVSYKQTDLIEIYDWSENLLTRKHGPDHFSLL